MCHKSTNSCRCAHAGQSCADSRVQMLPMHREQLHQRLDV